MLSKKLAALVALSMVTASSAAVAQSFEPVDAAPRASAPVEGSSSLNGEVGPLFAIAFIAVVIGLAYVLSGDDGPSSP
jgi:hypothetical protein